MPNKDAWENDVQSQFDAIGGEPLAGSGFEREEPEPGFAAATNGEGE